MILPKACHVARTKQVCSSATTIRLTWQVIVNGVKVCVFSNFKCLVNEVQDAMGTTICLVNHSLFLKLSQSDASKCEYSEELQAYE